LPFELRGAGLERRVEGERGVRELRDALRPGGAVGGVGGMGESDARGVGFAGVRLPGELCADFAVDRRAFAEESRVGALGGLRVGRDADAHRLFGGEESKRSRLEAIGGSARESNPPRPSSGEPPSVLKTEPRTSHGRASTAFAITAPTA
jgi:hypothetical protein